MAGPMTGRQGRATKRQRWLLAALCLLASILYLSRQTEPEPMSMVQERHFAGSSAHPAAMPPRMALNPACPEETGPEAADHSHPGHCPFCFVAAFSLEAGAVTLQVQMAGLAALQQERPASPHMRLARSVQARAPPPIG